MKFGNWFIWLGKKIETVQGDLVFSAMFFMEPSNIHMTASYSKIFWRVYRKEQR